MNMGVKIITIFDRILIIAAISKFVGVKLCFIRRS